MLTISTRIREIVRLMQETWNLKFIEVEHETQSFVHSPVQRLKRATARKIRFRLLDGTQSRSKLSPTSRGKSRRPPRTESAANPSSAWLKRKFLIKSIFFSKFEDFTWEDHPDGGQNEVIQAHQSVEVEHRQIFGCQQSMLTFELQWHRRVEVVFRSYLQLQDVNSVLDDGEQGLVLISLKDFSINNEPNGDQLGKLTEIWLLVFCLLMDSLFPSWNSILFSVMGPVEKAGHALVRKTKNKNSPLCPHLWRSSSFIDGSPTVKLSYKIQLNN